MSTGDSGPPFVFEFSAGQVCLDFANTVTDRPRCTTDHLSDYSDLLDWGGQAGLLSRTDARLLEKFATSQPEQARRAFEEAVQIREHLYAVFSSLAADREVPASSIKRLNRVLSCALSHACIRKGPAGYEWVWREHDTNLHSLMWPVAQSAAELLTSEDVKLVRECASKTCSWLFLDRSRTRRRRWCDMKTCGNRAKARRHYRKKKRLRLQARGTTPRSS